MSTVNVNVQVLQNARTIGRTNDLLQRTIARLSSGTRLISASDDPAGNSLAEKLSAQNRRVEAAHTNVQNAASYLQAIDGFLNGMGRFLDRMSELSILARDAMKNGGDVALYQKEFSEIQNQIRLTIGGTTAEIGGTQPVLKPLGSFNDQALFGPNPTGTVIATGHASTQRLTIPEINLRNGATLDVFEQDAAGNFLLRVDDPDGVTKIVAAVGDLADERSTIGALGSRLEFAAAALLSEGESLEGAVSTIRDTDVATESTRLTKMNLLQQSGVAMLTQASQVPRSILQLLE